jgi:molecular chaperone IbpA
LRDNLRIIKLASKKGENIMWKHAYSVLPPRFMEDMFNDVDDIFNDYKGGNVPYNVIQQLDENGKVKSNVIQVALAGYKLEEIKIQVVDHEIQIFAEKTKINDKDDKSIKYIHKGIAERSISLKFKLSERHDAENIESTFTNGMLEVGVPIKEERCISIKVNTKQLTE